MTQSSNYNSNYLETLLLLFFSLFFLFLGLKLQFKQNRMIEDNQKGTDRYIAVQVGKTICFILAIPALVSALLLFFNASAILILLLIFIYIILSILTI